MGSYMLVQKLLTKTIASWYCLVPGNCLASSTQLPLCAAHTALGWPGSTSLTVPDDLQTVPDGQPQSGPHAFVLRQHLKPDKQLYPGAQQVAPHACAVKQQVLPDMQVWVAVLQGVPPQQNELLALMHTPAQHV